MLSIIGVHQDRDRNRVDVEEEAESLPLTIRRMGGSGGIVIFRGRISIGCLKASKAAKAGK